MKDNLLDGSFAGPVVLSAVNEKKPCLNATHLRSPHRSILGL